MQNQRYGAKHRKKLAAVEKMQRTLYECPKCGKNSVRRQGNALWKCKACGATMAGAAYELSTPAGRTVKPL